MTTATAPRLLLAAIAVVAGAGTLDAGLDETWDLVALFSVIAVLAVIGLGWSLGRRRPTTLRDDLARRLVARARASGEPPDQALDRAVATYLATLEEPARRPSAPTPTSGAD